MTGDAEYIDYLRRSARGELQAPLPFRIVAAERVEDDAVLYAVPGDPGELQQIPAQPHCAWAVFGSKRPVLVLAHEFVFEGQVCEVRRGH